MATSAADYIAAFGALGRGLGGWRNQSRISDALDALGPDATFEQRANAILSLDPDLGMKLFAAGALGDYRAGLLNVAKEKAEPSAEDQLLRSWLPYATPQPSRLSPAEADAAEEAEASGGPMQVAGGPNLENAPALVQDKLMSRGQMKRMEEREKAAGQREGLREGLAEAGPVLQKIFNQGLSDIQAMDSDTIANALGPLQGADDPANGSWVDALSNKGAQTFGSILNYMQHTQGQGLDALTKPVDELPGGLTSTTRDAVKQIQASIINQLQRVQRVVGIGAQSDKELQQIIDQVGKLQNARTKNDLIARFSSLASLLNNSGIPIQMPSAEEVSGVAPTKSVVERYSNPPETQDASMSSGVNENTMVGGVNIGRTERQPPTPPKRALNALRAYAKNPEARAAFDEIYGPGAAEFYLQKYR